MKKTDITKYWKGCEATEENEMHCFFAHKITTILKTTRKFE